MLWFVFVWTLAEVPLWLLKRSQVVSPLWRGTSRQCCAHGQYWGGESFSRWPWKKKNMSREKNHSDPMKRHHLYEKRPTDLRVSLAGLVVSCDCRARPFATRVAHQLQPLHAPKKHQETLIAVEWCDLWTMKHGRFMVRFVGYIHGPISLIPGSPWVNFNGLLGPWTGENYPAAWERFVWSIGRENQKHWAWIPLDYLQRVILCLKFVVGKCWKCVEM